MPSNNILAKGGWLHAYSKHIAAFFQNYHHMNSNHRAKYAYDNHLNGNPCWHRVGTSFYLLPQMYRLDDPFRHYAFWFEHHAVACHFGEILLAPISNGTWKLLLFQWISWMPAIKKIVAI